MRRKLAQTLTIFLLSALFAKSSEAVVSTTVYTITVDTPTTEQQYLEIDHVDINVTPTGSVNTTDDSAFVISRNSYAHIAIEGSATSGSASTFYSTENYYNSLYLKNGGKLENNSSTNSTIYWGGSEYSAISIGKDSSVTNLSSSTSNNSYAVAIYNNSGTLENNGTVSGQNGILFFGDTLTEPEYKKTYSIINSGLIEARSNISDSYAIRLGLYSIFTIDNSGTITGNILGERADLTLINSGIINGNVNLGTNSTSSINLRSGGTINGKATFGNSAQVFNINQGATFNGSIAGNLSTVNLAGVLNLRKTEVLLAM